MSKVVESYICATTLAAYRGVYVSAANTVAYTTGITVAPIGVTVNTAKHLAAAVQVGGVALLEFNDSIAAGALVGLNNAGQGVPFSAAGATGTAFAVGVALEAVQATGALAKIVILPVTR